VTVGQDAGDLKAAWERTIARIDPPLASKILQAGVEFKENGLLLTLDGGHAVFEDSIKKNIKTIENILGEETGRKISVGLAVSQKKGGRKKGLKEKVMEEPLIREALELFEGRVVDISPISHSEKNGGNGGEHV
jgi:DNA polymerase III subunit gamma/tau